MSGNWNVENVCQRNEQMSRPEMQERIALIEESFHENRGWA